MPKIQTKGTLRTRWHHHLHPSVEKHNPRNGLPRCVEDLIHPTHIHLTKDHDEELAWTSRDHRKHRHVTVSPKSGGTRLGTTLLHRFEHMGRIEYWNISWWVAIAFTLGSIVWVINGFVAFLPEVDTDIEPLDASVGWTAFIGATIFEIGSILGILEAWNRDDAANFGWSVEHAFRHKSGDEQGLTTVRSTQSDTNAHPVKSKWIWFTLDGKYWHELGFLAAFSQLCAATIFWISGFTAIPTIQSAIKSNTGLLKGVFWTPQVIGGSGFIISATFIMLEAQEKWYKLSPLNLGWHVGCQSLLFFFYSFPERSMCLVWNMIGAIGFTLCGALGYAAESSSGVAYQSALSTFWGGWAFLIGSLIQWYESVNSI